MSTPFWFNMVPWLRLPGSGDVWQKVTNVTDWFSPKVEMNFAGNPAVEQDVNANVASYGRQLGILTEAVIAIADKKDADLAKAVSRLKRFEAEINLIKKAHTHSAESAARTALDRLDTAALKRVLKAYSSGAPATLEVVPSKLSSSQTN